MYNPSIVNSVNCYVLEYLQSVFEHCAVTVNITIMQWRTEFQNSFVFTATVVTLNLSRLHN